MSILIKGKDFGPTEQVTSTKLDELVDNASFTDTSENSVAYTGTTGTCLQGGGLEVTSLGQLQIADSGVNTSEISDSAVTTVKIADSNVTTAKIADDAVTQAKIADDAVGADQLASNAVVTASIVDSNVTTAKIANLNVTTAKIANLSVNSGKLANNAVTTDKIADDVELGGNPTTTTQDAADNSTRIATTAYVTSGIANALTGSGGIFGTIDSTADSNPKIFSKNSSGDYDSVAPSGDVTMAQDGAFTIQANAVEGTMLNSNTVDDSTIELSSDTLSVKDSGITKAKIENVANLKVLGNTSGSAAAPQEVTINDTDNMSDASATTLATSESIKAYVDTEIADFPITAPTGSTVATSGTVTLPGGLIMKFGNGVSTSDTDETFTFPTPFPNNHFCTNVSITEAGQAHPIGAHTTSLSGFTIDRNNNLNDSVTFSFISIGN